MILSPELIIFDEKYSDDFFSLVDKNRSYLKIWLPWLDSTTSPDDSKRFISEKISMFLKKESLDFFIILNRKIIGTIGIREMNNSSGIIGYWIDELHQSKGIMTWALTETIKSAKKSYDLDTLYLRCSPDNIRSKRVAEKCGFSYKKTIKDAEYLYGKKNDLIVYKISLN